MPVQGKTKRITVSNVTPTPVIAQTQTESIVIGEDASVAVWPTTAFQILKPTNSDQAIQFPIGVTYEFRSPTNGLPYQPGDVAGYVLAVSGSTTFFQDERGVGRL